MSPRGADAGRRREQHSQVHAQSVAAQRGPPAESASGGSSPKSMVCYRRGDAAIAQQVIAIAERGGHAVGAEMRERYEQLADEQASRTPELDAGRQSAPAASSPLAPAAGAVLLLTVAAGGVAALARGGAPAPDARRTTLSRTS